MNTDKLLQSLEVERVRLMEADSWDLPWNIKLALQKRMREVELQLKELREEI